MFKQLMAIGCTLLLCQMSFADRCPSVKDIKNNSLNGWKIYDSEEGTILVGAREVQYKKLVDQFALAEWVNNKTEHGSIHCYYIDKTGSNLEAYLAKENFHPTLGKKHFWYEVSGYMHCAAGMDRCEFNNPLAGKNQLAMKGKDRVG